MSRLGRLGGSTGAGFRSVPRLCVGTWQAAGWSSSNDVEFLSTLEAALKTGGAFIDTAPAYGKGHAEVLIGKVLARFEREHLLIASKFNHYESAPKRVRLSLERSLSRLGCGYLDLFQQHWPTKKPAFSRTLEELVCLREESLIRAIGVCNWTPAEFALLTEDEVAQIDCLQVCYSLLWRYEEDWLQELASGGVSILAYSPLAQGILADRSLLEKVHTDHRDKNVLFSKELRSEVLAVCNEVVAIAGEHAASSASVALAWILAKPWIQSVIVGQSNAAQLETNQAALTISLSSNDLARLEEVSRPLARLFSGYDTMWGWHSLRPR